MHIHSCLSACSTDPEQTPERMLKYAKDYGLKRICVTDHFWDDSVAGAWPWYSTQNISHISKSLPLPKSEGIEFLFGGETELDKNLTLALARENMDLFDFIIIPTTHLHNKGFTIEENLSLEEIAAVYVERLDAVLNMDLPFYKVGLAHLTTPSTAERLILSSLTMPPLPSPARPTSNCGFMSKTNSPLSERTL